jgi:endonuclease/exonuclease/phosphatase family metal-dependent hydrolase
MPGRLAQLLRARWVRRTLLTLSALYVAALVGLIAVFRLVGERWWAAGVALYAPRWVFLLPVPFLLVGLFGLGADLRRAFWGLLATSVVLGLVLTGFVFPWGPGRDPGAPSIRVLSYNVNSFYGGAEHVLEIIDHYAPDVVFFQEIGSPDAMLALLRTRYATVRSDSQFIVATRFPITSNAEPEKIDYNGRRHSARWTEQVLQTPLGPIAFYNVHPISPRDGFWALRGQGVKREILSGRLLAGVNKQVLQANIGLRSLQVANFAAAASAETLPVVIAGDTNLPGLSYVLNRSLSRFQDGFSQAGWGFGYTFPTNREPRLSPWMRIDRMFASAALRFVHFEVGRSQVSDHDCIVADLQRAQ